MTNNDEEKYKYTQNRELSWLRFNKRVLEEADDLSVPLLERLKFVAIFANNLDEFFMVRVGSIFDLACAEPDRTDNKTGWNPAEQLLHIYNAIPELLALKKRIYRNISDELKEIGINDIYANMVKNDDMKKINDFFNSEMLPLLTPEVITTNCGMTELENKKIYAAALLVNQKGDLAVGSVSVPASLPPYLMLSDGMSFVRTENILLHFLPQIFATNCIKEKCLICVTRNADINMNNAKFEKYETDFRIRIKKILQKRERLGIIRLELSCNISEEFADRLFAAVNVDRCQVFADTCPLNMNYVFSLANDLDRSLCGKIVYEPYHGRWPEDLKRNQAIIEQVLKRDELLFYPYDLSEPFLQLLNEAAENPDVLSIMITVYRLASYSKVVQALCRAAGNGKEVLVLVELRARFDEKNNLLWSEVLEKSGCRVIYGADGFKCHSKICLITMRCGGRTYYITQIGTGNYNEKTNKQYTDLSLITANYKIGEDGEAFFHNMLINRLDGKYNCLCVSPHGIKKMLIDSINEQIKLGKDGYICIKVNSLTERDIIDKFVQASQAGVKIDLIVRGICCILPGVRGYTDNISVTSVVGRFLEHARVYLFGRGETAVYISSADLMARNLRHRVEIACPIYEHRLRKKISLMLKNQLCDTEKACMMQPDGSYIRSNGLAVFECQEYFMRHSIHNAAEVKNDCLRISDGNSNFPFLLC